MKKNPINDIITIALNPCWDVTCQANGLEWGRHASLDSYHIQPAGKPLNVSRALGWMTRRSTAAGLWGQDDYRQLVEHAADLKKRVKLAMTVVPGSTRQNITVIDTEKNREMHLRSPGGLINPKSLKALQSDLKKRVKSECVCVFGGSMPAGDDLPGILSVMDFCREKDAYLAVDTSGPALKQIVEDIQPWLITPNVDELSELLGREIGDTSKSIVTAARELLDLVEIILVSRGEKGAILVTEEKTWQCRYDGRERAVRSTVGCGDYLLAGFLHGLKQKDHFPYALQTAVTTATAKAWGLTELSWSRAQRKIKTTLQEIAP
ncbi:MAG: bifunctional hydroxymethylpyrimidine kinase/phosphomethylpyrimidine kinase [Phycisphaerae bacterium]|nr:bifunctional hydroxymethylpyrimidine kinase/phosphomethylpyrimidine kinase [Phycisphaerae bacterium]